MAKEIKIIFVSLLHIITFMLAGNNKALAQDDFIVEWTFPSSTSSVSFGALTAGVVNYTWTAMPSGNSGSGSFTQLSAGEVTLSGLNVPAGNKLTVSFTPANLRQFAFVSGGNHNRLTDVKQWGAVPWSSMVMAFQGCSSLPGFSATDTPDLSAVTDMSYMFYNATSFNGDLSAWDVANVTDMYRMFASARSFNGDLSAWDVVNVTDMSYMFASATSFNGDLSAWDVANVTNMAGMFASATSFNGDLSAWDVANVTDMAAMFASATSFNGDLSAWDVANVTNMVLMFVYATSFNGDLSAWDVANVTNMAEMFVYATSFNQNLGNWHFNSQVYLYNMLYYSGMDCDHYSATLVGWQQNNPTLTGRTLGADGLQYGTNAVAARNTLTMTQGWYISGDSPSGTECARVLPITLLSFSASNKAQDNLLSWKTATEINNAHFILEHSRDGKIFSSIAKVKAAGNSNTTQDYSFVHEHVSRGIHYYRLKQVDYDGQYSYAQVISVSVSRGARTLAVYPNPVISEATVTAQYDDFVFIFDMPGNKVMQHDIHAGETTISIDGLVPGIYSFRFGSGDVIPVVILR